MTVAECHEASTWGALLFLSDCYSGPYYLLSTGRWCKAYWLELLALCRCIVGIITLLMAYKRKERES